MPNSSRPLIPIAIALIAIIAAIGYILAAEPATVQAPATQVAQASQPMNTATTSPVPLPTLPIVTPVAFPTILPPARESHEPLPALLFTREGQLWRSDGNGVPSQQLTHFAAGITVSHPTLAPNGSRVAFVAMIPPPITATLPLPTSRLYTIATDGTDLSEIWAPHEGILWLPSWANDGNALYVFANGALNAEGAGGTERLHILRIDLATKQQTIIVTGALDPTVAHTGTKLAYLKFDPDGVTMHLEMADPDGKNAHQIIDGQAFQGFYAPRFSPDDTYIYVAAIGGPQTDDQGIPHSEPASQNPLEWLASLFNTPSAQAHGAAWDIWRVNIDGTDLRRITWLNEDLPMVAFSPDGTQVAMIGFNGIYLMNPDGSDIRRIDPHGDHGGLDWLR